MSHVVESGEAHDLAEIVDQRLGLVDGGKQQHPAVGVLVGEDVVETAGRGGVADPGHQLDLARVGEAGHVEDDGAEVGVGASLHELKRLHVVVLLADLEVLAVHGADAAVKLGVLDVPVEDLARMRGVLHVVDLGVEVDEPADVDVGPAGVLLHLYVRRFPRAGICDDVAEHVHRLAPAVLLVEGTHGHAGILGPGGGGQSAKGEQGEQAGHRASTRGDGSR